MREKTRELPIAILGSDGRLGKALACSLARSRSRPPWTILWASVAAAAADVVVHGHCHYLLGSLYATQHDLARPTESRQRAELPLRKEDALLLVVVVHTMQVTRYTYLSRAR